MIRSLISEYGELARKLPPGEVLEITLAQGNHERICRTSIDLFFEYFGNQTGLARLPDRVRRGHWLGVLHRDGAVLIEVPPITQKATTQ